MTESDKKYIEENRLTKSMLEMSKQLGMSYTKVRNYMVKNKLMLSVDEINAIRDINRNKTKAIDSTTKRWLMPFA